MPPPLIFISHKQSDKALAEAVARFLESEATRQIRIFLSSSPGFEGVRFGKPITGDLRDVLADADVFLLLYTSADEDWSWCMWEWGVANHPASAKTTMVILQCGSEAPKIDVGNRRVNVRQKDEIHAFVKQYFTNVGFFPSLGVEPFGGHFSPDAIAAKAEALFGSLVTFPAIDPTVEWQTWPYLQLELPVSLCNRIKDLVTPMSRVEQLTVIRQNTKITVADPKALTIFGLAGLASDTPFSNLAMVWQNAFNNQKTADWFDSCCEQVLTAALEKLPAIAPAPVRSVQSDKDYIPLITKVRRSSYQGTVRFDLYFIEGIDSEREVVADRMLTLDRFFWRPLNDQLLSERLIEISEELKSQRKNRLPVLDESRRVRYVIHRGSVDEFIVSHLGHAPALTLGDLLEDPRMQTVVSETFAVTSRRTPIAEARLLMKGEIRDIFVTESGASDEPVEGWLTNVDLT